MPDVDFALIGHPESWSTAAAVISALRGPERPPIPLKDLREILPWIPPRATCRATVRSSQGHQVHGLYIDTFIPPDRLESRFLQENLTRVRQAAQYAVREGVRVAALGGFSSILLEGKTDLLPRAGVAFTTGNSLTVALIIQGIKRAVMLARRKLSDLSILVVGASGDVGSGCARCLAPAVKRLLLCARNPDRLRRLASGFSGLTERIEADTDLLRLTANADVVVCAASTPDPLDLLGALPPEAIVCDAGYPKNLPFGITPPGTVIFFGGLGQASAGIQLEPDLLDIIYPYPPANVAHGCLLEGVILAMEKRFERFSQGRGLITPERVEEIWRIALRHGIGLPPLFNGNGLVEDDISRLWQGVRR